MHNAIDLRVTTGTDSKPVEGLEKTLKVEITHIESGTVRVFDIRTIFRDPGHYTNDLILTAPGNYRLRFFGNIESTPINETFTSGPTTFGEVEPVDEIRFPVKVSSAREMDSGVRGAQTASTEAQVDAKSAKELCTETPWSCTRCWFMRDVQKGATLLTGEAGGVPGFAHKVATSP